MASRSWNRTELIGNLTRDPELRYTPNGSAVATFTIATNRTYLVEGERREEADFHRIVAWAKLAELCAQLLKKGNRVFVSGRLQNRSWEGQDGNQRQTTEIVIEDMILLTARNGSPEMEFTEDVTPTANVSADHKPVTSQKVVKEETKAEEPTKPEELKKSEPEAAPKAEKEDPGDLDDLPF